MLKPMNEGTLGSPGISILHVPRLVAVVDVALEWAFHAGICDPVR